ncbi:response regulator [Methanoplanus endosymbiosus]|uniref:Response regulator n=1 Tax=Methanoplanus endosymbiosus TaxID=33865 RepID=A0A9E7TL67_9EURY|nr:response regulator [Methanoplanus endosymbiosus]UUX91996.1 response regulator [Methanoplanus endosymbiosus]
MGISINRIYSDNTGLKEVLIVENDEVIASLIEGYLNQKDYLVIDKVSKGEDAIKKAIRHLPKIIIMDVNLDGQIDGITATKYITSLFNIPVIFISGENIMTLPDDVTSAGAACLLSKPFNAGELCVNIEIALKNDAILKKSNNFVYNKTGILACQSIAELDAYFLLDDKGRIIFMNPYAEHMINQNESRVLMNSINKFILFYDTKTHEPVMDTYMNVVRESILFGGKANIAIKTTKNGYRHAAVRAMVVNDPFGNKVGTLFKIHFKSKAEIDVTGSKRR